MPTDIAGFINVLDDAGASPSDPPGFRGVSGLTARLQLLVEQLGAGAAPWTLYLSRSDTLTAAVTLPAHLALVLAPGVVIRLQRGVVWTLLGQVDLGHQRCFELEPLARVSLRGPLDEVMPIWWRSAGERPDDAAAIEAAVAVIFERAVLGLPQARLALCRPYYIERTVRIEPPLATEAGGFELLVQGRHPVGRINGEGSINRTTTTSPSVPMINVAGAVRLVMSDVGLFGYGALPGSRDGADLLLRVTGDLDGLTLTRCTFVGRQCDFIAVRNLADLAPALYEDAIVVMESGIVGEELMSIMNATRPDHAVCKVQWCRFVRTESKGVADSRTAGVRVERGRPLHLCLFSCDFEGTPLDSISVACGLTQVEDCTFSDARLGPFSRLAPNPPLIWRPIDFPADIFPPLPLPTEVARAEQKPNVLDVELASAKGIATRYRDASKSDGAGIMIDAPDISFKATTGAQSPCVVSIRSGGSPNASLRAYSGPIRVIMIQVSVQGRDVMDATDPWLESGTVQATLTNVVQHDDGGGESIRWRGSLGEDAIVLQGCTLRGSVLRVGEQEGRGGIDVGTRFTPGYGFVPEGWARPLASFYP
jgi:hypothetical protein